MKLPLIRPTRMIRTISRPTPAASVLCSDWKNATMGAPRFELVQFEIGGYDSTGAGLLNGLYSRVNPAE